MYLTQVAKQQGIKTINVVRRRELADELKALGYELESLIQMDG